MPRPEAAIESVDAAAYTIRTDAPEADGTLRWTSTTLVTVEVRAGGQRGLGYTYSHHAAAAVVRDSLAPVVTGRDALSPRGAWHAMLHAVRNLGAAGIVASAISAVDAALWDVKARLLGLSLVDLLGAVRDAVPVYGSGGFTSYDDARLREQLAGWVEAGCAMVKIKIGGDPARDPARLAVARAAIGERTALFVDANGRFTPSEALDVTRSLEASRVSWFEEPVSSDDLAGLRLVRERAPAGLAIAAGEYGYDPWYFDRMVAAGAVDVLQADATRCLGITGFLAVAERCAAAHLPLSAHTAPGLHLHVCCAAPPVVHLEYFHDHVRIERALFEGLPALDRGHLRPDRGRPGHGLTFKRRDAEPTRVS